MKPKTRLYKWQRKGCIPLNGTKPSKRVGKHACQKGWRFVNESDRQQVREMLEKQGMLLDQQDETRGSLVDDPTKILDTIAK